MSKKGKKGQETLKPKLIFFLTVPNECSHGTSILKDPCYFFILYPEQKTR